MDVNYLIIPTNKDVNIEFITGELNNFFKKRNIDMDSIKYYNSADIMGPMSDTLIDEMINNNGMFHLYKKDATYREMIKINSLFKFIYEDIFDDLCSFIVIDMLNRLYVQMSMKLVITSSDSVFAETHKYEFNNTDITYANIIYLYQYFDSQYKWIENDLKYVIVIDPYSLIKLKSDTNDYDPVMLTGKDYGKGF